MCSSFFLSFDDQKKKKKKGDSLCCAGEARVEFSGYYGWRPLPVFVLMEMDPWSQISRYTDLAIGFNSRLQNHLCNSFS